jgi:hypothetical protein
VKPARCPDCCAVHAERPCIGPQDLRVEIEVPTPNTREDPFKRSSRVKHQRWVTRQLLRTSALKPRLPCDVFLFRVSTRRCDTDRAIGALAAFRDEIARWAHCVPFEARNLEGRSFTPRAPDGPNDGITWHYGQQLAPRGRRGFQAVRIVIDDREGEA